MYTQPGTKFTGLYSICTFVHGLPLIVSQRLAQRLVLRLKGDAFPFRTNVDCYGG